MESKTREIRPQPGPQEAFLRSPADVAIYGGAAGGGKSFALLLDALGYVDDPQYNCVIFRRTSEQLRTAGGLWDEAMNLYPLVGARSRERELDFKFPSGAQVKLDAIQHEKDKEQFQGAQICGIGFDELTHFTESQFTYMFSRNRRPGCKYKPYIKATTNPDASSWVKKWVAPWVDPEHELFPQQYGKVLYFTNFGGSLKFSTEKFSVENPMTHVPEPAKTITFIKAMASDNEILMRNNPGYIAGLLSLNAIDRARLLEGSWTIMEQGNMFGADWFRIIDQMDPEDPVVTRCRYWDMAATEQKSKNDPDYTVGVRMAITKSKRIIVEDVIRIRETPLAVQQRVREAARMDPAGTMIRMEQEPGSSGVTVIDMYAREVLMGWDFKGLKSTGKKTERAKPWSSYVEKGYVSLTRGPWNNDYINEHVVFPQSSVHDDQVDASSGAFGELAPPVGWAYDVDYLQTFIKPHTHAH